MRKYILILIFLYGILLSAQLSKDFTTLENLYDKAKLNELADKLPTMKAVTDDERALLNHISAMLKKTQSEALRLLLNNAERYPKTFYGQKSMLEAAKMYILERENSSAITILKKISSTKIEERFYWLAVAHYWLDDYTNAISSAENYLRLSPAGSEAENSLHLIADSYFAQNKYYSAITTLNKIPTLKAYDHQYLQYRLGYANELSGKYAEALQAYKSGYEMNKYNQIAFQIEDRLFAMRSKSHSLDLSFLYPYSALQIVTEESTPDTTASASIPQVITPVEPKPEKPTPETSLPLKVSAKPTGGFYLQSGRFSVETNAKRLSNSIRDMKLPAVYYEDSSQGKKTWVVLAGPFVNKSEAETARSKLSSSDINSFVIQY